MHETYNIHFAGRIVEGESLVDVRRRVGALFNAKEATLDKLFSGRAQLIKRNCSHEEALKYQSALKRAGALATITPAESETAAPGDVTQGAVPGGPAEQPAAAAVTASQPELALAPAGSDVLQPEERQSRVQRDIDVSALSLSAAGERLEGPATAPPPAPDTSHISDSAIGEAIPTLAPATPPPPPDTSGLSLAEPDTDLLEDRYRDHASPAAPSTEHLSVEPHDND